MKTCIALLGGTFDPVHKGHLALGTHFMQLLGADQLRVIPTLPYQKATLQATPEQRAEMVALAFAGLPFPVVIDRQEITRGKATYTIDTLRAIRAEVGADVSLCFLMGADQLQNLDSWQEWPTLFELAHFCVAARPGFALDDASVPTAVAEQFQRRLASPSRLRGAAAGLTCLAADLAEDVSATGIRAALQRGERAASLIPPVVLDYIEQHNLYKN
ncbi:nicotinate-nucleotide adenylyltransferase [Massilia sp. erpn]|uniref:nicotinate-nucleotide adenylyltransferase n=1 Tax=Massilia sp. erpn TaxID=2738142 RepID=UPI002104A548|nr:nicotinate-nucleotide adenylyltransferase [Massilia sp. erpn]UTY58048.1 nicotinate-nucleotide adenylyltransferase [Massilia sp. erpn]